MSEETLQPAMKGVQDALSKYVKRPPLSEKFLKKPPFRYLHDIVTAVIRETGFLKDVYTAEELDSNNVKDKESKIAFLNKLISAVKVSSGKTVTARPAKIVAGLEVEKTLELLQIIGLTIDSNVSNSVQTETAPEKKRTDEIVKNTPNVEPKDKPKKSTQNGSSNVEPKSEKTETKVEKLGKRDKISSETPSQKRDKAAEGMEKSKRASISRRESLKKELGLTSSSGALPAQKKESKNDASKTLGDPNKTSKENKVSSRRPSIQSKSVPTRKSSLKDSNRSVLNTNKKLQSVVIKEDQEEKPVASTTKINDKPQSPTSKKGEAPNFGEQHINGTLQKPATVNEIIEPKKSELSRTKPEEDQSPGKGTVKATKATVVEKRENIQKESHQQHKEATPIQRPGSARPGSRKLHRTDVTSNAAVENEVPRDNSTTNNSEEIKSQVLIRPRTANRPPSARPGAPKLRDRGEVVVLEEAATVAAPVNVIEEGTQDQFADDKDNIVLIESEQAPAPSEEHIPINDADQGQLVHQILKTQKELSDSVAGDTTHNRHLEIEWEAGRQREKDIVTKEIEKIRNVIQILTSAANPLGKLFDFLQEDVDEMQRELQHWKNLNEKFQKQQHAESEFKKQTLEPLRKQLQDVETSIEEEYRQIASIKTNILDNDDKILKLVSEPTPHHQTKARVK